MAIEFFNALPNVDPKTIEVVFFGTDHIQYVEARVSHKTMRYCCGANGQTDGELIKAFSSHRERIEAAVRAKYAARDVKYLQDRILVRLSDADL